MSRWSHAGVLAAGACVLTCVGVASGATAVTSAAAAPPAGNRASNPSAATGGTRRLRGYVVVSSGAFAAPNGLQTRGFVSCPTGTVPLGGGVDVASPSIGASVNSSFPSATGWVVDVNNASGADTSFLVQGVCARRPRRYSIVAGAITANPATTQSAAFATCPPGARPLSGGAVSGTFHLDVNLGNTVPTATGWRVDQNNASTQPTTVTALVVCAKLPGYAVTRADAFPIRAFGQRAFSSLCPGDELPTGGGMFSNTASLFIDVNSSFTPGVEWGTAVNNGTGAEILVSAIAVCVARN